MSSSSSSPSPAAAFRAKTTVMKSWRPRNPPSNRDRLELYALHKQSVAGDAPIDNPNKESSVADRSKLAAWRTKRGLGQGEAMARYVEECDRQLRVYGGAHDGNNTNGSSASPPRSGSQHPQPTAETATSTMRGGEGTSASIHSSDGSERQGGNTTPQNTPANANGNNNGSAALLCPRGLAAIPLLCAAASESRSAYLARLQVTHPSNGWWAKQEPLCLEANNPLALPEKLVIGLASQVEQISLVVSNYMGEGHAVSVLSPRVLQAFLWPLHNVFLCCWISLILTTTYIGSMVSMCQTLLFGAKRTNSPLGRLFVEEVHPSARAVESLCEQHQVVGVRVAGLALMPLMMLCDLASSVVGKAGILAGSAAFVGLGAFAWWYWLCVLPWLAVCGLCLAVMSGWCFGLIELAGN